MFHVQFVFSYQLEGQCYKVTLVFNDIFPTQSYASGVFVADDLFQPSPLEFSAVQSSSAIADGLLFVRFLERVGYQPCDDVGDPYGSDSEREFDSRDNSSES